MIFSNPTPAPVIEDISDDVSFKDYNSDEAVAEEEVAVGGGITREFVCPTCNKRFNSLQLFNIHVKKHGIERPHVCVIVYNIIQIQ